MVKKISVSVSDDIYYEFLADISGNNRSAYISKLIRLGSEYLLTADSDRKSQILKLIQEKSVLEFEVKTLKMQLGKMQNKVMGKKPFFDDISFTEEELNSFMQALGKDKEKRRWWCKSVELFKGNPEFREGRFNLYKNSINPAATATEFNLMCNMALDMDKRGILQNIERYINQEQLNKQSKNQD
jgi:hypothetical protein